MTNQAKSRTMKVLIRADASDMIGSGHVMRCLTLADTLRARGAEPVFAMRMLSGNLTERARQRGFDALELPPQGAEATARRAGELEDAAQTRAALAFSPGWIVVDHYGLGAAWESAMRQTGASILAIDDLADRAHDCDVLLDQNLVSGMEHRYAGLADGAALRLLGPRYAMLKREYLDARSDLARKPGPVRRVLAYFGAADRQLTIMAVQAFLSLKLSGVRLDVVLDTGNPQHEEVRRLCALSDSVTRHSQLPDLAGAMARADLCIGASGATSWERLCMGLPAIVVTMADNQIPIAAELARRGLITWIGDAKDLKTGDMADAIKHAAAKGVSASDIEAMMNTVDGLGVERVCDTITVRAGQKLVIRRVRPQDKGMVLEWANDPGTRRQAFNPALIAAEDHERWFTGRLANPEAAFYIAETLHGIPAGQARFEEDADGIRVISYLAAPLFRGRGLGQELLAAAIDAFARDYGTAPMKGLVKAGNETSARIFRALGFAESMMPNDLQTLVFQKGASV